MWFFSWVGSIFGIKTNARDASTQTETSETSSANQRDTQGASMQATPSETASQPSGASTVRTLFGSFSRDPRGKKYTDVIKVQKAKQEPVADVSSEDYTVRYNDPVIQLVLKKEIIKKLKHIAKEDPLYAQLEKQIINSFNDRLIKMDTELLNKIDAERKELEKNTRTDSVNQATAKAEEAAAEARRVARATQTVTQYSFGLNIAPIATAPEHEGRIVPKKPPQKKVRFNPEDKKTWNGPEKKICLRTSKKVPKNQGGENAQTQDRRSEWEKERDEFMKKADAGAVKRKEQIEKSRTRTQKLLTDLVESNQWALASYDDRVNAFAKNYNLSQKELEELRESQRKESGLDYDEIETSRDGSRKGVKTHSSKVGNPPHPGGHACSQIYDKGPSRAR